jgi:hypothetical protein
MLNQRALTLETKNAQTHVWAKLPGIWQRRSFYQTDLHNYKEISSTNEGAQKYRALR